jgi:phosphate transport system substrate-binding protein
MHKKPADPAASETALKFFAWAYDNGSTMAEDLDYVPLPSNVVTMVKKSWSEIIGTDGKPIFHAM